MKKEGDLALDSLSLMQKAPQQSIAMLRGNHNHLVIIIIVFALAEVALDITKLQEERENHRKRGVKGLYSKVFFVHNLIKN